VSHPDPRASELRQDLDGLPGLDEHVERGLLPLVPIATVPALDPAVVGYSHWIGTQRPTRPSWCCGRHRPS
jgi:hypothetical protein